MQQGMESRDDTSKRVVYYETARFWDKYREHHIRSLADQCFGKHYS